MEKGKHNWNNYRLWYNTHGLQVKEWSKKYFLWWGIRGWNSAANSELAYHALPASGYQRNPWSTRITKHLEQVAQNLGVLTTLDCGSTNNMTNYHWKAQPETYVNVLYHVGKITQSNWHFDNCEVQGLFAWLTLISPDHSLAPRNTSFEYLNLISCYFKAIILITLSVRLQHLLLFYACTDIKKRMKNYKKKSESIFCYLRLALEIPQKDKMVQYLIQSNVPLFLGPIGYL